MHKQNLTCRCDSPQVSDVRENYVITAPPYWLVIVLLWFSSRAYNANFCLLHLICGFTLTSRVMPAAHNSFVNVYTSEMYKFWEYKQYTSPDNPQSPAQLTQKYSHVGPIPLSSSLAEHVSLKLQQLPHEGQVRGDDLTPLLHKIEGFI